jgi:hypothetical protein
MREGDYGREARTKRNENGNGKFGSIKREEGLSDEEACLSFQKRTVIIVVEECSLRCCNPCKIVSEV